MANKYRTAQGKMIDMAALAAKHEKVRAVGNMKVNARGDTIDANGKVIIPVTEKVTDSYAKTISNISAQLKKPKKSEPVLKAKPPQLTTEEMELDANLSEDLLIEKIKLEDIKQDIKQDINKKV